MTRLPLVCILLLAGLVLACRPPGRTPVVPAPPKIQRKALVVGRDTVMVEVAATEEMRQVGLMFRTALGEDEGMLFVFDSLGVYRFWMRNTELPLSIAFITGEGVITNIMDMTPHDEQGNYGPPAPVLYALEMNQGWFARHRIQAGDTVRQLPGR